MIRVTVELVPNGVESRARTIGVMKIVNDASGDWEVGNYNVFLHAEYTRCACRRARVEGFRRLRQSVWTLVGLALKATGHTRQSSSKRQ